MNKTNMILGNQVAIMKILRHLATREDLIEDLNNCIEMTEKELKIK